MQRVIAFNLLIIAVSVAQAAEFSAHGIVDMRASYTNSVDKSYLNGGQGKFATDDGYQLYLAQTGADLSVTWENGLSIHAVLNSFQDPSDFAAGISEAYLKYRSLPNQQGYRLQLKAGIFYPDISLENNAYAWASRDTLNSSTLNTWIGEEIRALGGQIKVTRLGKFNNNNFDLSLSASAFLNNDPAGALLAWHGWTMSSRQTLWGEKQPLPWFPARDTVFVSQAADSDPFLEIDNKLGYHLNAQWKLRQQGSLSLGYYDNRAIPYKVEKGQYGWDTKFIHAGLRWRLTPYLALTSQFLSGNTLMQSPEKLDMVNNDFYNLFASLSYRWLNLLNNNKHKSTLRIEHFTITDNDNTVGDNNNENGQAYTLSHQYRLSKQWFVLTEVNIIDSHRPARAYENDKIDLIEQQYQIALRYFF